MQASPKPALALQFDQASGKALLQWEKPVLEYLGNADRIENGPGTASDSGLDFQS